MPTAADLVLNSMALAAETTNHDPDNDYYSSATAAASITTATPRIALQPNIIELKNGNHNGRHHAHTVVQLAVDDACSFRSAPDKMHHQRFFRDCVDTIINEAVFEGTDRKNKVLEWQSPVELEKNIDFACKRTPTTHDKLLQYVKNVIKYSVKTGHPYFMNQLFSRYVNTHIVKTKIFQTRQRVNERRR